MFHSAFNTVEHDSKRTRHSEIGFFFLDEGNRAAESAGRSRRNPPGEDYIHPEWRVTHFGSDSISEN